MRKISVKIQFKKITGGGVLALLLFNTLAFAQSGAKWATGGNTNATGDFLGSSNNQPLLIKTNNAERMRITETGNVGIGIAVPQYKLDIAGRTHSKGNAYFDSLVTALYVKTGIIYDNTGSAAIDVTNRRMYNAAGAVKIDWQQGYLYNVAPSNTISLKWITRELVGTDGTTTNLNWGNKTLQAGHWDYDADYSGSYTQRSLVDKEYVDSRMPNTPQNLWTSSGNDIYYTTGNVGIGTTTPQAKFEVASSGGANSGISLRLNNSYLYGTIDFFTPSGLGGQFVLTGSGFSNGSFGADEMAFASELTDGVLHLASIGSNGIIRFTTGANSAANERMRITSGGNIGIRTTTPTQPLEVAGTIYSSTGGFQFPDGSVQTTAAASSAFTAAAGQYAVMNNLAGGNSAGAVSSFIGSGTNNIIEANAPYGIILGGSGNLIENNAPPLSNQSHNLITSGENNTIRNNAHHASIIGGSSNVIETGAINSVILGGSGIHATLPNTVYVPQLNVADGNLSVSGKIITARITSLPGDSMINFGDSTLSYNKNTNAIHPSGSGSVSGMVLGGNNAIAKAPNAVAIGQRLSIPFSATGSIIIGNGTPGKLTNNIPMSLMVGFNSNIPTLFVGTSSGNGTTGNVGIGTAAPIATAKLDVAGKVNATDYLRAGNPVVFSQWITSGSDIFYDIDGTSNGCVGIGVHDASSFNCPYTAAVCSNGKYLLAVAGAIRAKALKVEPTWSDFVFEKNYSLMPLDTIEAYIKSNGHLPAIPDAKEVRENGIEVGQMNALLLQKIEELTLYMIQMKKDNDELKKEIKKINK